MHKGRLVALSLAGLLLVAGAADLGIGSVRSAQWARDATLVREQLTGDQSQGASPAQVVPLLDQMDKAQLPWWSPLWITAQPDGMLNATQVKAQTIYTQLDETARRQDLAALASWHSFEKANSSWLPRNYVTATADWQSELAAAGTPRQLSLLGERWDTTIAAARHTVASAKAAAAARLAAAGGVTGVLGQANSVLATAQAEGLSTGNLPSLAAQLKSVLAAGGLGTALSAQLQSAVGSEQTLIDQNGTATAVVQALMPLVDQAAAEGTPGGGSELSRYGAIQAALTAASTAAQLTSVEQSAAALKTQVAADLAANVCNHPVGGGKVITINLSLQEMIFYDKGCEVAATPVTTGMAQLRTPTGTFHIFDKQSPYEFISPWPLGSPFYYYPSWVHWVMEFDVGGYYIHDAPWEPPSQFGPGSLNGPDASHGCVQTPTPIMSWAYGWTPLGTPVIISA